VGGDGDGGLSSFYGLILQEDGEYKRRWARGAHPPPGLLSFTQHPSSSYDALGAALVVLIVNGADNILRVASVALSPIHSATIL
jgi:hypothetical protein